MKIGYQGIEGSNSEKATFKFINVMKLDKESIDLVPLVTSYEVANKLKNNKIDYGVMAIKNSIGGIVKETNNVLNNSLKCINTIDIEIHHCLFKKKKIDINNIKKIASHEQAILQCKNNINKLFINKELEFIYIKDTALAAKLLDENELDDEIAIICSKDAGTKYDLDCIYENLEDGKSVTEFGLYINNTI